MPDLLVEIGCEEIPARMITEAIGHLWDGIAGLLETTRLLPGSYDNETGLSLLGSYDQRRASLLSTPRRLAVLFPGILARQQDVKETMIGPSVSVAYKDGVPTKAAEGFAKKAGVPLEALERKQVGNALYLQATVIRKGKDAATILGELLPREIAAISWPKSMYWRKRGEVFVRPVRWLVAMLDEQVIPMEIFGIPAGNTSHGHRIIGSKTVAIPKPGAYVETLRDAKVLGYAERELRIRKALDAATRTIPGARWREDKSLLDTVVNLTEFPSVVLGGFDPEFLTLPDEVLVTVMRDHQKYFALEDESSKLLPHFLAVLNTDGDPDGLIRHGNERVLRARFNDARFFWETDQKIPLRQRVDMLKSATFQKDLGSYYDKTIRVQKLGSLISEALRNAGTSVRSGVVHKAALLAKTDLTTELVKEFTELQGIVGGLYAKAQQLDSILPAATAAAIGDAIYDQYKPESMEDRVPRTLEGAILAIADKADSIAGMFALGLQPTGSKDPFALRRAANGIVKIIVEHKVSLPISKLFSDARAQYEGSEAERRFAKDLNFDEAIASFMRERLEFYLRDVRGFAYDVVNAVLAAGSDDVVDVIARAEAVSEVRGMPDFMSIAAAFKRINNILKQAREKGITIASGFDYMRQWEEKVLVGEEQALAERADQLAPQFKEASLQKHYSDALVQLSKLRPDVDRFFDKVMVMVDHPLVRANRLALLESLLKRFSTIADFSEIVTEGKVS
jgi:glycyl-tRNA synthetase beta chain